MASFCWLPLSEAGRDMKITSLSPGGVRLSHIPLHLAELFRQIPQCEELRSEQAEGRLFPSPVQPGKANQRIAEDWKAYVQPGLDERFRSSREVVNGDLRRMTESDGSFGFEIKAEHLADWISSLNQVRLAIAARHGLLEADIAREEVASVETPRDLAILRVHFYGFLQQLLIEQVE